jgi:hypothetical protein
MQPPRGSKHVKAMSVPVPMPVGDTAYKTVLVSRSNSDKQKRSSSDLGVVGLVQGSSPEDVCVNTVSTNTFL